jgi:hypothetical protein
VLTVRTRLLLAALLLAIGPAPALGAQESRLPPAGGIDTEDRTASAPKPVEGLLSLSGAFMGGLQWIANSDVAQGSVFGASSLELTLTARPTDSFLIFLDVEGLLGPGPDQKLGTLSRLNKKSEDLEGKEHALRLMKLIFRPSWLEERVRLSAGKLDVEDYFDRNAFAEDEEEQFLNAALLTSPMLKAPSNGPGMALRVNVGEWRYAFGVHGLEDVDGDLSGVPFMIGEAGRRNVFALEGHYRLWARVASVLEDRDRVTWGTGVSIDQLLTANIGVFFRAGVSRSQGESLTSYAWSAGVQVTPTWPGRGNDAIGIGFSEQREPAGRERVAEAYYRLELAEQFSVIANVQWVLSGPNTVTGATNRNVVVPGVRAVVSF